MAKNSQWPIIAVILIAVIVLSGADWQSWIPDLGIGGGDLVDVNKQIKFHIVDDYSGGPKASLTDKFGLYNAPGDTILEANLDTDANGLITTGSDYASGAGLWLRMESTNDKKWWQFTVPQMNAKDAEAATYNLVRLGAFAIGTYTDAMKIANGTAFADDSTYDISDDGASPHWIYTVTNTGADNTGIQASDDPLYDQNWDVECYIQLSGTEEEKIVVYDFSYSFTLGDTIYHGSTVDPYKLIKHKVGSTYKSLGSLTVSFWMDTTGTTGALSVTMQIHCVAYADHVYAQNHGGSFGPEIVELCEDTFTIQA